MCKDCAKVQWPIGLKLGNEDKSDVWAAKLIEGFVIWVLVIKLIMHEYIIRPSTLEKNN